MTVTDAGYTSTVKYRVYPGLSCCHHWANVPQMPAALTLAPTFIRIFGTIRPELRLLPDFKFSEVERIAGSKKWPEVSCPPPSTSLWPTHLETRMAEGREPQCVPQSSEEAVSLRKSRVQCDIEKSRKREKKKKKSRMGCGSLVEYFV